jgi:hypothetical protein
MDMEDRLARIEQKVDRLADAITMMARIEERMSAQHDTNARFGKRLDDHEDRMRVVEKKQASGAWIERGVWVLVAASVALLFRGNGA